MSIQLIIKGNSAQAHEAARDNGISLNQCRQHPKFEECICRCASDYRKLIWKWFACAPLEAPYPVGTLLWYSDQADLDQETKQNYGLS